MVLQLSFCCCFFSHFKTPLGGSSIRSLGIICSREGNKTIGRLLVTEIFSNEAEVKSLEVIQRGIILSELILFLHTSSF